VSALGHYLEAAGIPTVSISLIREHTSKIRPPRALWVPFELGRPLGVPGDAAFQMRVLRAALALLDHVDGPMIADYGEDVPAGTASADGEGWVCPVSFPAPPGEETALAALKREIAGLKPWYDLGLERRGRTTFGLSGLGIDQIADYLAGFAERGGDQASPLPDIAPAEAFKHCADDLQAFYQEAATAQPGHGGGHADILDWFWGQTQAGKVLLACREAAREGGDERLRLIVNRLMVPRLAASRLGI
jgi:hypothetical protein